MSAGEPTCAAIQRNLTVSDRLHVDGNNFGPHVIAGVGVYNNTEMWALVAASRHVPNGIATVRL